MKLSSLPNNNDQQDRPSARTAPDSFDTSLERPQNSETYSVSKTTFSIWILRLFRFQIWLVASLVFFGYLVTFIASINEPKYDPESIGWAILLLPIGLLMAGSIALPVFIPAWLALNVSKLKTAWWWHFSGLAIFSVIIIGGSVQIGWPFWGSLILIMLILPVLVLPQLFLKFQQKPQIVTWILTFIAALIILAGWLQWQIA